MPLATAAWDARAARRATAAAIAVALQGVFYFLILHETIEKEVLPGSAPLEVTLFETPARPRSAKVPRKHARRVAPRLAPRRNEASQAVPSVAPQPIASPRAAAPTSHAPVDWQHAIQSEVREEESGSRVKKLNFGFPRLPPQAPGAPARFGWDYAPTHRIVPLPHGGMIINFSERCFINVWYPIPMCRGKEPANGHLFDGLEGPWNDRTNGLP
jgi:hypothetical protein